MDREGKWRVQGRYLAAPIRPHFEILGGKPLDVKNGKEKEKEIE